MAPQKLWRIVKKDRGRKKNLGTLIVACAKTGDLLFKNKEDGQIWCGGLQLTERRKKLP